MLTIENLHASVADKPILKGLNLTINAGIHAIMGPNGAGKSTTGYVLGGRPGYEVTEGSATQRAGLFAWSRMSAPPLACFSAFSIRSKSPAFQPAIPARGAEQPAQIP
jgi:ABC-type hemin transport system ATPase subunit